MMPILSFVLALGALQDRSEWPTYHGGYTLDGLAGSVPPDAPIRLWTFKADQRIETTPVSAGGRIFFTTVKGVLIALDLQGKELWRVADPKDPFATPILLTEGLVIVGTRNGILIAFDAATKAEKWRYDLAGSTQGTPNRIDLPGGKKGVIAISQGDGCLHAVDLETGKGVWKTEPVERCDGSAGVANNRIAMGSCASAVHVYSTEPGAKRMDIPLGGDNQVAGGVAFSGPIAFAGSRGGKLFAIDTAGEKILWTNTDTSSESFATPAVNDRLAIFSSNDGRVYALDRATGKQVWKFETDNNPSSPVIAGNRVVVSSGGTLYLLDLDGKKIWSDKASDEITSPAIVGGRILVGAGDGTLIAFGKKE